MSRKSHPIDSYVGRKLRVRRRMLGLSLTELGKTLGITFQQVQKYERGINRIGASRLFLLARALKVPITYFYEGAEALLPDYNTEPKTIDPDTQARPETIELVQAYYQIADPKIRSNILRTVRIFSG